ncbi:MAG: hypothetical protein ACTSQU_06015 [Promethearchaeota archaeon]
MAKKKFIFLLISLLFLIPIPKSSEEETINLGALNLSSESDLPYGYYRYFHQFANENYEIRWIFSGNNTNVGIIVYAMTDLEFFKLQVSQSFNYTELSNGLDYEDSGTFIPPSFADWYVLFLNADFDRQTTYLTCDVEFIEVPSLESEIIGLIIAILAVGGIIGVFFTVSKKIGKYQHKQEASQKIIQSSNLYQNELNEYAQSVKLCAHCKKTHRPDAIYCYNCGRAF